MTRQGTPVNTIETINQWKDKTNGRITRIEKEIPWQDYSSDMNSSYINNNETTWNQNNQWHYI